MEAERIADQLRRAHEGGAWHGPSLRELLHDLDAEQAAAKPVAGAHSIREIVLHIEAWERAGLRRLGGDRAQLSDEEDWSPSHATGEAAWRETLERLKATNLELRAAVARLADEELDRPVAEGMSSVYVTIHGVVQHTLYHAGQIAVLRRAQGLKLTPIQT